MSEQEHPYKLGQIKSKISKSAKNKSRQKHRGVLFIDCVPSSTKNAFKAACAAKGRHGESMRDAVIRLLRFYVKNKGEIPGQEDDCE